MVFGNFLSSILVACIIATGGSNFMLCEARKWFDTSKFRGREIPDDSVIQPGTMLEISCESDTGAPFNSPGPVSHFSLPPLDSIAPIPPSHDLVTAPPYGSLPPPPSVPAVMPSPPKYNPSPSPPEFSYSPPGCRGPSPPKLTPGPPLYSPPVVHSPAPPKGQVYAVWCVAKPTVPDSIIQVAMDYACGAGANCKPIQLNGPCYQPPTLLSHASFAFNSYWQQKKQAGGTCDFGGTAMLVTVDPSFNECHFDFS
ncbi:leucine-rich repeat extensin-like protein 3 [Syzygium oleosum]|uniref:leucine-rich repeat extensin-like protein 3 n=1 Tax=Syzygium oleosum TaxID=219896 RepID=UPI0011D2A1A4|nr:leucine-rich repeat extensin-like protein 3 [Syzygium oleosum]